MKNIILAAIIMAMPLSTIQAQRGLISTKKLYTQQSDINAYAAPGAVPEVEGKVVFQKDIEAFARTKDYIYNQLAQFASLRFEANMRRGEWREPQFFKNIDFAQVTRADREEGIIVAQGAEELIFSNRTLSQDYTQIFYQFTMQITDRKVHLRMDNIAYIYAGSNDTTRIPAEDWITDKESLNKKGELRRISGKFRVKTIDLFNELAAEIEEKIK